MTRIGSRAVSEADRMIPQSHASNVNERGLQLRVASGGPSISAVNALPKRDVEAPPALAIEPRPMSPMTNDPGVADEPLLEAIRRRDPDAWTQLIARYEGRLHAYFRRRLDASADVDDLVQETLLGFLVALPNYDSRTPLESFLFAIAAHKLTDTLRRIGRRPRLLAVDQRFESSAGQLDQQPGAARRASSLMLSREQNVAQDQLLTECLRRLIGEWLSRGEFERLRCAELLFVVGVANRDAALTLGITEQSVANHKQFVVAKLRQAAAAARVTDIDWSQLES